MKILYKLRVILFILIILVPIVTMNLKENQVSEVDNRTLTNFSDISISNFPSTFENYLTDRIGFRSDMFAVYTNSMYKIFNTMVHPSYEEGKDGYIFSKLSNQSLDSDFQETYSTFIKNFEDYAEERNIDFLYTLEPSKATVYTEYLPEGYNYSNENLEYLISLLKDKNVNFLYNGDVLNSYKDTTQLFDVKYDAGHWNETGAIIGISAIIDRLNELNPSVDKFDINKFSKSEHENTTLPVSYFPISETTYKYKLIEDNSTALSDLNSEIRISEQYKTFTHYKNEKNSDAPKILVFAGSYFNDKDKFLTESFSEYIKVHNYHNVIDYDYYINLFNPDIVLFESTEYTHSNGYFPVDKMKNTVYNKAFSSYDLNSLSKTEFATSKTLSLSKQDTNISNFKIELSGDKVLSSYIKINDRILDGELSISENNTQSVEFSVLSSEIENTKDVTLYLISEDEQSYNEITITLN